MKKSKVLIRSALVLAIIGLPILLFVKDAFAVSSFEIDAIVRAADHGDSQAQYRLGVLYEKGKSVPQDFEKARNWYRCAAESGHPKAQARIGFLYLDGGTPSWRYPLGIKWLHRAALQRNAEAQFALGEIYEKGKKGAVQDSFEAARFYRMAAEQGKWKAAYPLGCLFADPEGRLHDLKKAFFWWSVAEYAGEDLVASRSAMAKVEKLLSPKDVTRSRDRAAALVERVRRTAGERR